ncbi:MAG: PAS domain S-box protein [Desulfococcaceae bacterium]
MAESPQPKNFSKPNHSPLSVTLIYAVGAAAWIFLSDWLLKWLFRANPNWIQLGTAKGLVFVLVTAGFLYFLLKRHVLQAERERARREEAQQKGEIIKERFQILFDSLVEPAFLTDANRNILRSNPAAKRLFQTTEGATEGNFTSREDYLAFGEKIRDIHAAGGGHVEWRFKTLEGPRDFRISISPLPEGGRFFVLSDISDQKVAEAMSRSLNQALETRVAERTAELEAANEALQNQVDERKRVMAALQENEETFRSLFENAGSLIAFLRNRVIQMANPACSRALGYSPEEMAGMNTQTLHISPEKYEEFAREVYPKIQRDGQWNGEWPFRRRNGEILWFEWSMTGKEAGDLLCVGHDVTIRKQAETALRESESRFRWLIQALRHLLWTTDPSGQTTFLSQSWRDFTGHDPARLAGDEWSRFIHPDDVVPTIRRWKSALTGDGERLEMELRMERVDGLYRWMNVLAVPVRDGRNQIRQWMAVAWDIHESREAQERLRRSEARFRRLVNLSPYGIEELDTEGRIHFANPALARIFGLELEEITSKTIFDLARGDPEELRSYFKHLCAERPTPTPYFGEYLAPSGRLLHIQVDWDYVVNDADELEGFVAVISDITRRKRDEDAVREAKESAERLALRAEAATRAKSLFLANMTHEIRTPLNAILGYCQILRREPSLPSHCRDHIEIMYRGGRHLLTILNDILDMSKIEAGRMRLHPKPTDLYRLMEDMAEMFGPIAASKSLEFRLSREKADHRWVMTDRSKLRQVLVNLLGNALKFTAAGSVYLILETRRLDSDRVRLSVSVADTGRGIARERMETLFDAFNQGEEIPAEHSGTGLGLSISREIVRLMGGDITVAPGPGKGSVFRFHVEVEPADLEEPLTLSKGDVDYRARLRLPPGASPPRVLVAEDRKTNRDILVHMLEAVGAEVRTATNGGEAVAAWKRLRPELIFMDLRMPVMDGLEATRRIVETAPPDRLPIIIAVTASAFEEDRSAILAAGCRDLLVKPVQMEDMLRMLRDTAGWELESPAKPPASTETVQTSKDIDQLSPETREALLNAVARADVQGIVGLVDRLEEDLPAFAAAARKLMERFDYETLAHWLTKENST